MLRKMIDVVAPRVARTGRRLSDAVCGNDEKLSLVEHWKVAAQAGSLCTEVKPKVDKNSKEFKAMVRAYAKKKGMTLPSDY